MGLPSCNKCLLGFAGLLCDQRAQLSCKLVATHLDPVRSLKQSSSLMLNAIMVLSWKGTYCPTEKLMVLLLMIDVALSVM